ncbi:MAG: hypothetical protein LBE89_05625 [Helicobacteraceae bacterium]|nr:hypothetical protein [Helicobacteraceae bacterium]
MSERTKQARSLGRGRARGFAQNLLILFLACASALGEGVSRLEEAAAEISGRLPIMIDEKTRWDRLEIQNGSAIYTYTLVDPSAMSYAQEDWQAVIGRIKSSSSLRLLRDSNLTLRYLFNGSDGKEAFALEITADKYQ